MDDIIEHGERIGRLLKGHTFESFCADESDFQAVLFSLLIIGEATKNLPDDVRIAYPAVNWTGAAGLRDIIVHRYFGLDSEIIWDAATVHVPRLLDAGQRLLAQPTDGDQDLGDAS
ncbi:MAG: DUF86 domain-containing protein [Pseudomonadota bacterium]|nr:DUF86 domain-containing protein [Pseudomonadota bacterium]